MFALAWFLAKRFIFVAENKNSINIMAKICFLGILISTFSLALVNAIMHGFEQATHNKLQGIHADITISAQGKPLKYAALTSVLKTEYPTITAFTPQSEAPAMIRGKEDSELPTLISVTGIDPETIGLVTILPTLIQQPAQVPLPHLVQKNSVLIGHELAEQLRVKVGDEVELYTASEDAATRKAIALESHAVVIGGIFKTGIDEFDAHIVFTSHTFFAQLFPEQGITTVLLKCATPCNESHLIQSLKDRLHVSVYSWKDLYPALVSALILEKYAMFFILALISLIAIMSIISLLFMYIIQKTGEIVLLKTLGIPTPTITLAFGIIGILIACTASLCGIALAWSACYLLEKYPFIQLPDAYYVTHVPAHMTLTSAVIVFCVVLALSICATWIPTRRIKSISVPDVLKKEL